MDKPRWARLIWSPHVSDDRIGLYLSQAACKNYTKASFQCFLRNEEREMERVHVVVRAVCTS